MGGIFSHTTLEDAPKPAGHVRLPGVVEVDGVCVCQRTEHGRRSGRA